MAGRARALHGYNTGGLSRGLRRFIFHLAAFCALPAVLLAAGEAVLQSSGELWPLDRVFAYQASHADARYLRAVDQVFYAYKYRGILLKRPTVLVAGSSRTMKFRGPMFGERAGEFYNAGGMLNSARDVHDFSTILPADRRPVLLVLGIDLWWLNDGVAPAYQFRTEIEKDVGVTFDDHVLALRWLVRHPRSLGLEVQSAVQHDQQEAIGIEARERGGGFRGDGSYVSPLGVPPSADGWRFVDREEPPIIERARGAVANFVPAASLSSERLELIDKALDRFRAAGVLVVGYLPPFSSEVLATLRSDARHAALWSDFECRVPELFRRHGYPVVDASDVTRLGMDDRAMSDGIHAEETFHLHVVRAMLADTRVREALPGADASVARALASPRTNFWQADFGS